MTLSPAEKTAGRRFKAWEQAKLDKLMADDPPTITDVQWFHSKIRHPCAKQKDNRTAALTLKERYVYSPVIEVSASEVIPARRFAFIYKEGKCKCGVTARSPEGHFVADASQRPPVEGRVAR